MVILNCTPTSAVTLIILVRFSPDAMRVSVIRFYQERFYSDTYAILSHWGGVLLGVEFLLLYKKWLPSLLFFSVVQVAYW